jgi:hypothetical protein
MLGGSLNCCIKVDLNLDLQLYRLRSGWPNFQLPQPLGFAQGRPLNYLNHSATLMAGPPSTCNYFILFTASLSSGSSSSSSFSGFTLVYRRHLSSTERMSSGSGLSKCIRFPVIG